MSNPIHEAVALLERVADDIPGLTKTELEYQIADIQSDVQRLEDASFAEAQDIISDIKQGLDSLYNEV